MENKGKQFKGSGIKKYIKEDWEDDLGEEREDVVEYVISFEPGEYYDEYHGEFITEDKDEADDLFDEIKEEHKLDQVSQYIEKTWEWDRVNEEYYETDVDVYFNAGDELEFYGESKKTEGYSLGDDKESFDVYKHTADFLNKVGKALEDLGWKFNKEKGKFEKEDITIDMEAIQDNVNDLYIGSNKLKLSNLARDYSSYEDIGEDTGIIYYVSTKADDYDARQLASKINSCEKLEENKEVKTESLGDRYEVWQNYYEDGRTTTEYVMSFDNYAEAQRFASGLMQDPDCEAWVKDKEEESKKVTESEEKVDYSKFTPTNKVLSGNKGLSEDKIDEMRWALPDLFKNMTDEQKQIFEELSLREMVMSCLVYGNDIHTAENNVSLGKYRGKPYVAEYYDTLGKDVTEKIIKQQTDYFNRGKVIRDVGTDSEGVTYNSFEEPEEESKKVTEAKPEEADKEIWEKVEKIVDTADNEIGPDQSNEYEYDEHIKFVIYRDFEFEDIFEVYTYLDGEAQGELDTGDVHLEDLDATMVDIVKKLQSKENLTETKYGDSNPDKIVPDAYCEIEKTDNGYYINCGIGTHTSLGGGNFTIYPEDYLSNLHKEVKKLAKERGIKRVYDKVKTIIPEYNAMIPEYNDNIENMIKDLTPFAEKSKQGQLTRADLDSIEEITGKIAPNRMSTLPEFEWSGKFGRLRSLIGNLKRYETDLSNPLASADTITITESIKLEANMTTNKVIVYQIQETANCSYLFMDYDFAVENGGPDMNDYEKVAEVEIDTRDTDVTYVLDEVFTYGNTNIEYYDNNPEARSISVSDILEYNGKKYYVDSFGFEEVVGVQEDNKEVKTEAEDMTAVKDNIEKAKEDTESTEQEIEQVKGSLEVLKTDEEEAIAGYDTFVDNSAKVVDDELADAIDDEMQEIIQDEKDHIEKLDTIKTSLGESKPVELGDKEHNWDTLTIKENEITRPNDVLAVLDRRKIYELNYTNGKKDLVRIYSVEFGHKIVCKSYISGQEFKLDILDMLKDGRLVETDYLVEDKKITKEILLGESKEVTSVPYKTEKEARAGVRSLKKAGIEARIEKQDDGTFVVISKYKKEEANTLGENKKTEATLNKFQTLTVDKDGNEMLLKDVSYNNACSWLEKELAKAGSKVVDTETKGNKTIIKADNKIRFEYDEEKGTLKRLEEAIDPEAVKEKVEKAKADIGLKKAEEMIDTEKELTEGIKKEIIQYAKQQGLDVEKLQKQGQLDSVAEALDNIIGEMVSKTAVEYMDTTGKDIEWDFDISNNDIQVIIQ